MSAFPFSHLNPHWQITDYHYFFRKVIIFGKLSTFNIRKSRGMSQSGHFITVSLGMEHVPNTVSLAG